MITYDNKLEDMTMECDECDGGEETVGGSWQECIDELKLRGWKFKKGGDSWYHVCPQCIEEQKNNQENIT